MGRGKRQASRQEKAVSWTILGVLVLTALWVYHKQFDYDRDVMIPRPSIYRDSETVSRTPESSGLAGFAPQNTIVLSPVEAFDSHNLSEKINGKAELYLSAGFVMLHAQRFAAGPGPQSWFEVFVYDMGTLRQAFSVFSLQRRRGAEPLELTPFSYETKNAVFFVRGSYYVEVVSSEPSTVLMEAARSFGRSFVEKNPTGDEQIEELALFPAAQMVPHSAKLFVVNAFGFSGLKNVFAARYELNGEAVTGFLSRQQSPEDAEKMAEAYQAFLLDLDGRDMPLTRAFPNGRLIQIFDRFEFVFHHDGYVAGVHDAESQAAALELSGMIRNRLDEAG